VPTGAELYDELSQQSRIIVPITFVPGQEEIDHDSEPVVASIVDMMNAHPDIFLRIECHTDNTGDPEDNMRLSGQRAYAIRTKLIDDNVAPDRLDAVGVGGLQPIADNDTEEGRAKNRRIELVLKKKSPTSDAAVQ
jgi:outer membrane protein OmpA-like peptidoglycan-associated protein